MQKAIFSSHLLPFHLESITRSVLALYVGLEQNLSTQRKLRLQYTSETTTLWCQDKKKWLYYINPCILHLLPFIKVDSYINKDIGIRNWYFSILIHGLLKNGSSLTNTNIRPSNFKAVYIL